MSDPTDPPKIHIDSDWKADAQAEKQRLEEQSKAAAADDAGGGEMPPANFETLISTFATQALFAMGAIPDPRSGQRMQNMDLARHNIDMLGVLEEKTKGNITQEQSDMLASTVYELRSRYVQMASPPMTQ
jgi:hypothetical protein